MSTHVDLINLPELKEADREVLRFIQVICDQHEGLADNGWQDIWCLNCDAQETQKMSPVEFAEHVVKLGWAVDSLKRATALCPKCVDPPESTDWAPGMLETDQRIDRMDDEGML